MRSWASSCWPHSAGVIGVPTEPRGTSKASAREWAGSVDSTTVRRPASAQRRAVAAATVVLPTPPLPVNSRMRGSGLNAALQILQGGVQDEAAGPVLHEPRQRHLEVGLEVVHDVGRA